MSKETMSVIQIFTLMFQIIIVPVFSGAVYVTLNVICATIIIGLCYLIFRRK